MTCVITEGIAACLLKKVVVDFEALLDVVDADLEALLVEVGGRLVGHAGPPACRHPGGIWIASHDTGEIPLFVGVRSRSRSGFRNGT